MRACKNLYTDAYDSQKAETTQIILSDKWINKILCINAMEQYPAIKNSKAQKAITWKDLENITLSQRNIPKRLKFI